MMSTEKNTSRHFKIFSDCVLVKGAKSSAIYDLSRHRMVLFPTEYFDFISSLDGRNPDLSGDLYSSDTEVNRKFNAAVDYLIKSEVAAMVSERSHFTALSGSHDRPSKINNSIIDISSTWHDFSNIFAELDQLGCEFVQVRIFSSEYTLDKICELVAFASDTTVRGIDFLICHKPEYMPRDLVEFVSKNPLVAGLVVHSSPMDLTLEVDRADAKALGFGTRRRVRFITQPISSDAACGKITIDTISAPSVPIYTELLNHNGCLNKKISIDVNGEIKNCPSFCQSYGKIGDVSLGKVVDNLEFRRSWAITKDQVSVCKDCQFRFACTDCRAHLQDSGDLFSKPAHCSYDPYRDVWEGSPAKGQMLAEEVRMDSRTSIAS
jgi:SPASM domain peptide maturase of grasp-with-spasm system